MTDFFDQLWEQMRDPRQQLQKLQYLEKIKSLIPLSPPLRALGEGKNYSPQRGRFLAESTGSIPFQGSDRGFDFFVFSLGQQDCDPARFRAVKSAESTRPFWRADPLLTEQQVLETRAMGADAYCLDVASLDHAQLQFLTEVGRDFEFPAFLRCSSEEELARAVQIQDLGGFWLRGPLVAPQLIDLPWFHGKIVIFEIDKHSNGEHFRSLPEVRVCLVQGPE